MAGRVEDGLEAAVTEAANAVQAVRFKYAPVFEKQLDEQAEQLAAERARLEAELAQHTERERDLRMEWRMLAAAVPGADDPPLRD